MKKIIHQMQFLVLGLCFLIGSACTQNTGQKGNITPAEPALPLAKAQMDDGKWVILDSKKNVLYDVFFYDNGPDYASDGLIRIVKNGKIGYADAKTFEVVIAPQFDCAFPFEDGQAKVSTNCKTINDGEHRIWESDAWRYVNKKGE